MKKGFTLIELLAVIVILAIIALISSPIIMGLIEDTRKEAFKDTTYGIVKAGEIQYSEELINGTNEDIIFTYDEGSESSNIPGEKLDYSGSKPNSGTVIVDSSGKVTIAIHNGVYCAEKRYQDNEVTISEKTEEECKIPFECGDILYDLRDGQKYATVEIGTQCWMAENLRYTGNECLSKIWNNLESPDACKKATNNELNENSAYRKWLQHEVWYQWEAASTACPGGWKLPTDDEWKNLEMFLGMSQEVANNIYWRGTDQGDQLKGNNPSWCETAENCATSGFNAMPTGYYEMSDPLNYVGMLGYWWGSSVSNVWIRNLYSGNSNVLRNTIPPADGDGFSVRCLLEQ